MLRRFAAAGALAVLLAGCAQAPPPAFERAEALRAARLQARLPDPKPPTVSPVRSRRAVSSPRSPMDMDEPPPRGAAGRNDAASRPRAHAHQPTALSKTTPKVGSPEWAREQAGAERRERELQDVVRSICATCLPREPKVGAEMAAPRAEANRTTAGRNHAPRAGKPAALVPLSLLPASRNRRAPSAAASPESP
ncbi:MAG: hypothetical protein IRZ09_04085 [Variibacter sp.]|nr:hypothetical protein [Variibacter sp.]